ncbi:hypothetical protein F0P96_15070 [Hymenobacter busanensis]|uniref:Uncharacterized protein n=1 Tax=Hymenobacter busanensis TaxID=2607656 RepID=A0A7L4ZZL2_9BACT|nr:hypothetical protein [Hymenobacter busanensis]KAA9331557.1 hypothetical protein F0P96_15070 [Hymenobacter busanensis]QHJ08711.1 hypothetical protein GUY19_16005 [Hymenobacter busanensis]
MRLFIQICSLAVAAGLSGCAAVVPHTLQTPLVQQRGDTELGANVGLHGTDVQAAHAISDRLTVTGSGHQRIRSKHGHWAYSGEAGAGYTLARPNKQRWTVYGGLGYGAGYAYDTFCPDLCDLPASYRVRYGYGYVQPTYLWTPDESIALSAGVKMAAYDFLRWRTSSREFVLDPNDPRGVLEQRTTTNQPGYGGLTMQPGYNVFARLTPRLRLQVSQSFLFPLQKTFPSVLIFATGVGVQYHFGGHAAE